MSYSVEILADATGEASRELSFGAYFLFLRWKRSGDQGVEGHLESDFLAWGADKASAKAALGAFLIEDVQRILDGLIA